MRVSEGGRQPPPRHGEPPCPRPGQKATGKSGCGDARVRTTSPPLMGQPGRAAASSEGEGLRNSKLIAIG